jgi:peroxiredoxin
MDTMRSSPIRPGDHAPEFTLPAVDRDGTVSLADYRGRSPLMLALFVGLWCPFCRRSIAQLGMAAEPLRSAGVECLGVVASATDNARLYFKYRPTRLRLAADSELTTHRAYGLPRPVPTPELMEVLATTRINPTGELPEALPVQEAAMAVAQRDGYVPNATDDADLQKQWPQLRGQFLIDRYGIVRWANIECGAEGVAGIGKFPTLDEMLAAARTLAG